VKAALLRWWATLHGIEAAALSLSYDQSVRRARACALDLDPAGAYRAHVRAAGLARQMAEHVGPARVWTGIADTHERLAARFAESLHAVA
jgi:hypothetical protein